MCCLLRIPINFHYANKKDVIRIIETSPRFPGSQANLGFPPDFFQKRFKEFNYSPIGFSTIRQTESNPLLLQRQDLPGNSTIAQSKSESEVKLNEPIETQQNEETTEKEPPHNNEQDIGIDSPKLNEENKPTPKVKRKYSISRILERYVTIREKQPGTFTSHARRRGRRIIQLLRDDSFKTFEMFFLWFHILLLFCFVYYMVCWTS